MRTLLFTFSLLFVFSAVSAQEDEQIKTLFSSDRYTHHGGYGAPVIKYRKLLDQDAWWVGARGGWLIDHQVTIGFAAYGLASPVENDEWLPDFPDPNETTRLVTGYGGLLIEPIILYKSPVHISLPIVIGAGGANYAIRERLPGGGSHYRWPYDTEVYFALEPGIEMELNLLRFMRINIGTAYLYTSRMSIPNVGSDFLRGWTWQFAIKFGSF